MSLKQIVDVNGKFTAMQRVAAANGLRIEEDEECERPWTDLESKVVNVPPLKGYMDRDAVMLWDAYGYHEAGHHAPAVMDHLDLLKKHRISINSLLGRLVNIGEDIRNERNDHGLYIGRDKALAFGQSYHAQEGAKIVKGAYGHMDPDMQIVANAQGLAYSYRGETFQPAVSFPGELFCDGCEARKFFHLKDIMGFTDAESVLTWALKFLEESGRNPEEELEKSQEQYEQQGGSEPGDEEGDKSSGKGSSDDSEDGEGKSGSSDKGDEEGEDDSSVSYEDILAHSHESKEFGDPNNKLKIEYDHKTRHDFQPSVGMTVVTKHDDISDPVREMVKGFEHGKSLSGSAKRLFQSKTQTAKVGSQDDGKLDRRALWKVPTGAREVFYKDRDRVDPKETAIYLLTDASGSMCGGKYYLTAAAVAVLNEALSPLRMAIKISSFTEDAAGPLHFVMKNWNDRISSDRLMGRYVEHRGRLEQNSDGESILWAAKDLMSRSEPRKILIVLSDGMPASWAPGDCATFTKRVIEHVSNHCECYGIGIMDDSVRHFYPEYSVINDARELDRALLEVVKRKIIG